jgi:Uncharacterised nucleotidyltransferase
LPETPSTAAPSTEWRILIKCASSLARPTLTRFPELARESVDWQLLTALAQAHGVLPLVATVLQDVEERLVPPETLGAVRERQRSHMLFTLRLTAALFQLLDHFAAADIETLVTKGPSLSFRCYGDPGLREYTDLDLIIRSRDALRASEAMIALGFEPKVPLKAIQAGKFPGEYVFRQPDSKLTAEFHTERTFRYHPRPLSTEALFGRGARVTFDGHDVPALATEDELLLICIHGAKHFWERLIWIADVGALVSRQNIDWPRAMAAAREAGAERMLRVGLLLAASVLGLDLPAKIAAEVRSDAAALRAAAQIAGRLPCANLSPLRLFARAAFRTRMRGGWLRGAGYLVRLSFYPTEEDWAQGGEEKRPWLLDAIGRPFRLARKYGRASRM